MAAPANITCANLSGVWPWNRNLSDDPEPLLQLAGVNWIIRKAVASTPFTITLTHTKATTPPTLTIQQSAIAGLPSAPLDQRVLDWSENPRQNALIGKDTVQTRLVKGVSVDMQSKTGDKAMDGRNLRFLSAKEDSSGNPVMGGHLNDGDFGLVQGWLVNEDGTTLEEIWGFETVGGERRLTRRVVVTKEGKSARVRLVYDYRG